MADKQIQANISGYPECGGGSASSFVVIANSAANTAITTTGFNPSSIPTAVSVLACPQSYSHVQIYAARSGDPPGVTGAVYVMGKFRVQRDELAGLDEIWLPLKTYGTQETNSDENVVVMDATQFPVVPAIQGTGQYQVRGPAVFSLDGAMEIAVCPSAGFGGDSILLAKLVLGV